MKSKRVQYALIVWILFIEVIQIAASLLSENGFLSFFAVLGFDYLSVSFRVAWDAIFTFTVLWLAYRLSKDVFQVSISFRSLSKKELLGLAILVLWVVSAATTTLQFAVLATAPLAEPKLEASTYNSPAYYTGAVETFPLNLYEANNVSVDLSKSVFTDPFSVYENGQTFEYATKYSGSSYFTLEDTPANQEMIETRFCGNGTNGLGGWFAYRISLEHPISVDENSTILLLLRLTPSSDGSAWAYYKVDLLTEENLTYSLAFKFHDVPVDSAWINKESRICYYRIGSVLAWKFYQFNIDDLFYTSFSKKPCCITNVEYAIGANSNNDVSAYFLLAKISSNSLKFNNLPVEDEKANVKLSEDGIIEISGLTISRLFVTLSPSPTENINVEWSMLKISRIESYNWDTRTFSNMTEVKMSFNASSNYKKLFLNGMEITSQPQGQQLAVYELDPKTTQVNLVVTEETDAYLLSFSILLPIIVAFYYVLLKVTRYFSKKSIAKSLASRDSRQEV
jgi:hypothetical protein